jgi:hypothetical protein
MISRSKPRSGTRGEQFRSVILRNFRSVMTLTQARVWPDILRCPVQPSLLLARPSALPGQLGEREATRRRLQPTQARTRQFRRQLDQ